MMKNEFRESKDTFAKGQQENRENFSILTREMAATKREAQESKTLAAKATTIANETRTQLEKLEKRVSSLENQPQAAPSQQRTTGPPPGLSGEDGQRDWDQLGGETGETAIVGGFRDFADKTEKQTEWNHIHDRLPEDMKNKIQETIVPTSLGSIVIIKLRQLATIKETRLNMIAWTKEFKAQEIQFQAEGEGRPRTFYAAPSKPYAMRQRNAKHNQMFDALKLIAGPEREARLRSDLPSGRILFDRKILVEKARGTGEQIRHLDTMQTFFPDITNESLGPKN